MNPHPCLSCGACCAFFRVSFHWSECDDETPDGVPLVSCEDWNSNLRVMRGTRQKPCRCEQLEGNIGDEVHCRMYEKRPSTCRDFIASFEDGEQHELCDRARLAHDLPALRIEDWIDVSTS